MFWVRVFPYGVGGAGRVWRRPTSRTSAALDTAAVGSMSLVIFDDPAARLIHGDLSVADPPSSSFFTVSFGAYCARGVFGF